MVRSRGAWTFSRSYAMTVLGLAGTGVLRPVRLRGVIRVERGGIWLTVPGRRARAPRP